jgi:hypothetical protein
LPFDHHLRIAAIAPRAVLVANTGRMRPWLPRVPSNYIRQ